MTTKTSDSIRPTKKQRELLSYIEQFINEHGYSPSYREIMNGLNYTSVATVSLHVTSLIRRGHLRKRDRSARSLEVVEVVDAAGGHTASESSVSTTPGEEAWLIKKVDALFKQAHQAELVTGEAIDDLHAVVKSLKLLGFDEAAQRFSTELDALSAKDKKTRG